MDLCLPNFRQCTEEATRDSHPTKGTPLQVTQVAGTFSSQELMAVREVLCTAHCLLKLGGDSWYRDSENIYTSKKLNSKTIAVQCWRDHEHGAWMVDVLCYYMHIYFTISAILMKYIGFCVTGSVQTGIIPSPLGWERLRLSFPRLT